MVLKSGFTVDDYTKGTAIDFTESLYGFLTIAVIEILIRLL